MSAALLQSTSLNLKLVVLQGPHKGESFSLSKGVVSIGRDDINDIVFSKDSKVSRQHAEIRVENGSTYLINLSLKNPVYLNQQEISKAELLHVNIILLGDTEFKLELAKSLHASPPLDLAKRPKVFNRVPNSRNQFQTPPTVASQSSNIDSGKTIFYAIIAIVVIAVLWLLNSETSSSVKKVKLRTQDQVVQELIASEGQLKSMEKQIEERGQNTIQYKTAQEHYIKGFRDYRNGQYARAISSFQAALSFFPQHELARKYYTLSKRKFDEQVQLKMIQGKRYRGKNNYRLCKSSYASVMIMLKDQNDPIYKEAKQFYDECRLQLESGY